MSRSSVVLILIALVAAGGGLAWYLLHPKASELDVAAKPLPELPAPKVSIDDWPWWRGLNRDNSVDDAGILTKWSETENIIWKTPIPGRGHSSPILVGNRIFLTSADESAQRQFALGLDRASGQVLWEKTIHEKNLPPKHYDNTWASGTPASDGERVFVVFPNKNAIHVTALDVDGNIQWTKEVGPHGGAGSHGAASSLAMWGSYIYVCDSSPRDGRGWIAGLYRSTGEFWRKGHKTGMGSYGSLTIANFNGKPHLIHAGNDYVRAFKPASGELIWETKGFGEVSANTPTFSPTMIFASTGVPRKLLALNADGSIAWKKESSDKIPYPPSMLYRDGHLYAVSDKGLATCFDATTGEEKWSERLPGGGSYYASPLLVGEQIYACNRDGQTTIFEASPDGYSQIAKNKLEAGINSSPVAVGGKLFVRTDTHLYCIGKK
jgi:outer membrane protein assembly factor BamB